MKDDLAAHGVEMIAISKDTSDSNPLRPFEATAVLTCGGERCRSLAIIAEAPRVLLLVEPAVPVEDEEALSILGTGVVGRWRIVSTYRMSRTVEDGVPALVVPSLGVELKMSSAASERDGAATASVRD